MEYCTRKRTKESPEEEREGWFWVHWYNTPNSVGGEFDGDGAWGLESVELKLIV